MAPLLELVKVHMPSNAPHLVLGNGPARVRGRHRQRALQQAARVSAHPKPLEAGKVGGLAVLLAGDLRAPEGEGGDSTA